MSKPETSLVIPVFNEEESLGPLTAEIREVFGQFGQEYEIVFVDDGSDDRSLEILLDIARDDSRARVVRLERNSGKSAALDAGFRRASGDFIVMLDADLQNDPADIPLFLRTLRTCDAVSGVRRVRLDSWLRRVSSRIGNAVRRRLTGDATLDSGCGFQGFRRESLADIHMFGGMHRFIPTLVKMAGGRVEEVPVNHRPRRFGRAKYGVWNRLLRGFGDLLAIRWMQKRWIDFTLAEEVTPGIEKAKGS